MTVSRIKSDSVTVPVNVTPFIVDGESWHRGFYEVIMINKLQSLIERMSGELPGVLAAAVVTIEDGLSIAEASCRNDLETAAASAYLASIVKSNAKAIKLLADDEEVDDILVTTSQYHFIIRHQPEQPFFIFLMTSKETWLGKARMLIRKYENQFAQFAGFLETHYQM